MTAVYVMDNVVSYNRPGLYAESVNTAHIRKLALTYMMNMVLLDYIIVAYVVFITPHPAAGNAGVVYVADIVMADFI